MDADVLADDEFHPREPDAVIRQHRRVVGEFGIAEIDHDLRFAAAAACRTATRVTSNGSSPS